MAYTTATYICPHLSMVSKIFHTRPGQAFGTNRIVRMTMTTKCRKRYQARLVLSFGLKLSYSQCGNRSPKPGNLPAKVITIAKIMYAMQRYSVIGKSMILRDFTAPPSAHH